MRYTAKRLEEDVQRMNQELAEITDVRPGPGEQGRPEAGEEKWKI